MDTPTYTPPPAPEPQLAYLPTYDEEVDETAHLGPLPISLLVIQAALAALQNEEQQLLDDPRSQDWLTSLDCVLHAFVATKFTAQPSDPYAVQPQNAFTPHGQSARLQDSLQSSHRPTLFSTGPVSDVRDVENALQEQAGIGSASDDASSGAASEVELVHERAASGDILEGSEQDPGTHLPGSVQAEHRDDSALGETPSADILVIQEPIADVRRTASSGGEEFGSSSGPATGEESLSALFTRSPSDRPSTSRMRSPMPTTATGIWALDYVSQRCDISEGERNLETAVIKAARFMTCNTHPVVETEMQSEDPDTENIVRPTDVAEESHFARDNAPVLPSAVIVESSRVNHELTRGKRALEKGLRGIFRLRRQGLVIETE